MRTLSMTVSWLWRLLVAGAAHVVGLMLGAAVATALALEPPRNPSTTEAATGMLLLLAGGIVLAVGLAVMARGLDGSRWRRWAILGTFAFVVNGVGTAIELSEFSTLGGGAFSTLANLPAAFLCAIAVTMLFPAAAGAQPAEGRTLPKAPGRLAASLGLAFLAFPVFYFVFGMMIAPIVLPHYEQIDFIIVPPLSTILLLMCTRSALFLLATLPVITGWQRSRGRLAFALAAGHFTAVGLSGLVQTTIFPPVLRVTHGVEILATSICYGLALAWLLFTPEGNGRSLPSGRHSGARLTDPS